MSILWCGGEDIDFQNGTLPSPVDTNSSERRTSYCRCAIGGSSGDGVFKSATFTGAASCWLSAQIYTNWGWLGEYAFGLGKSGADSGLFLGQDSGSNRLALNKRDAGSQTQLVAHASMNPSLGLHRIDMQIISYGSSGTVNVYWDGALELTYTGNIGASGVTALDQVWIHNDTGRYWTAASEIIVADEDTRPFAGLLTMAPTSNGTTNSWSNNTYTNVNPTSYNDSNAAYSNTDAQDQQYNVTDLPSGSWAIKAVRVSARAWKTSDSSVGNLKLGFNSGGSVGVGSSQSVSTTHTLYEQIFANNPVTSSPWAASEMNALQINLRAAT